MKLLNEDCKSPLSLTEKAFIKKIGLTLGQLNKRYHQALSRTKVRKTHILPKDQFYRQLVNAYVRYRAIDKTTPFEELDIHSKDGGYTTITLLERTTHKRLHSELAKEKAFRVKELGFSVCKYCGHTLDLNSKNWIPNKNTLVGLEVSCCRKCRNRFNSELKNFRKAS